MLTPSMVQVPSSTTRQLTLSVATAPPDGFCKRTWKLDDPTAETRVTTGVVLLSYCTVQATTGLL